MTKPMPEPDRQQLESIDERELATVSGGMFLAIDTWAELFRFSLEQGHAKERLSGEYAEV